MSAALAARAEVLKLARLLRRDAQSLAFLEPLDASDVRRFREQATDLLYESDRRRLQRLAAASERLPTPIVASIAERSLGPLLCARIAGLVDPARAIEVAARLSPAFLAEVAAELDPRRASKVIAGIPARQVGEVTAELVRHGELVAMGRLVSHLSEGALRAALAATDDASLLRVALLAENDERLDLVVELLPVERLRSVIRTAAREGLWPEALDLVTRVGEPQRVQLAQLAARDDDEVLDTLVRAAHHEGVWKAVLPLLGSMDAEGRERFARLRSIRRDGVLEAVAAAAAAHRLWRELLPLAPLLPPASRARVARTLVELEGGAGDRALASLVDAAEGCELWDPLLRLLCDLDAPLERRLGESVARLSKKRRVVLGRRIRERGLAGELETIDAALAA